MVSKNNIAPISTALVISAYLCSLSFYIGNQTGRIVSQAVQNSWIHKSLTEM
jgi:predicted naringenin-chalcone synthase